MENSVNLLRQSRGDRGAILVHVALMLAGLLAFSAFSIDNGIMMLSRGQGQNSADAAALAAGAYLAWDDLADQAGAKQTGMVAAQQNFVWGVSPDVTLADITFPPCPPGAPGPPDTCVRADVFRNQRANGNPLPAFFSRLVGIPNQGIQATATAQVVASNDADCLKPFGIYDRWIENEGGGVYTLPPDPLIHSFERYEDNSTAVLPEPDFYRDPWMRCPAGGSCATPGGYPDAPTGYNPIDDYGTKVIIKAGNGGSNQRVAPGLYHPVVVNPIEGRGGNNYRENIATCDTYVHHIPDDAAEATSNPHLLDFEPGSMVGPTNQGVARLLAGDTAGYWNENIPGPENSCMETGTCTDPETGEWVGISPRWIALPLFNPDEYDFGRPSGRQTVEIVNIIGLWLEGFCRTAPGCPAGSGGNDILGYITHYPALAQGDLSGDVNSSFLRSVILVR